MRGVILSAGEPQGLIIGDDGRRYTFTSSEWRDEDVNPGVGTRVDFTDQWPHATGVMPAPRATPDILSESETRAVDMEGTVLRIPRASGSGAIRGDDGVHYTFASADWQSGEARPYESMQVEFVGRGPKAEGVRPVRAGRRPRPKPSLLKRLVKAGAVLALIAAGAGAGGLVLLAHTHEPDGRIAAYAEQIDAGRSGKYADAYAHQMIISDRSETYARPYAEMAEAGKSDRYAHAYATQVRYGKPQFLAHAYAELIEADHSPAYAREFIQQVEAGKSESYARAYAELIEVGHTTEGASNSIAESARASTGRAIDAALVLAMFSTTDDTEADRRAASVLALEDYIGRGDLDNDTVLKLLNDVAPEWSISERQETAERLARISTDSDGQLDPQQSLEVANELTRLVTGHGIDAEQRAEGARQMLRLSQSGELNPDNAAELMDVIAPEWSVTERKEALGFLAWQFAQGEWDADSTQRTAEEGYTLLTGGEIQLERRIESGVELIGEGLKRYGGENYDDEDIDKATALLKEAIGGNLSSESVVRIMGFEVGERTAVPGSYNNDVYAEAYDREYHRLRDIQDTVPHPVLGSSVMTVDMYTREQAAHYAHIYAQLIAAGMSEIYASSYTGRIRYGAPERIAVIYAGLLASGESGWYAEAYVDQILAGKSPTHAHAYASFPRFGVTGPGFDDTGQRITFEYDDYAGVYAEELLAGRAPEYAIAYVEAARHGLSEQPRREYAGLVAAGRSERYALAAAERVASGRTRAYARAYAAHVEDSGFRDFDHAYAHAYALMIEAGETHEYATDYATQAEKDPRYARVAAERLDAGYSPKYVKAYIRELSNGKSRIYARAFAAKLDSGATRNRAHIYAFTVVLNDWLGK